ncbi:MAG: DUF4173 domain-containing protein [Kineosporiaceae bacterium]
MSGSAGVPPVRPSAVLPPPLPSGSTPSTSPWGTPPHAAPRPLLDRLRVDAAPPRRATTVHLAGLALLVGLTAAAPPGVHWLVIAGVIAAIVASVSPPASATPTSTPTSTPGAGPRGRGDRVLLALAFALIAVAAVRASPVMVTLSLIAGIGLATAVVVDARRWPALLAVPLVLVRSAARAVVWHAAPARATAHDRARLVSWARGLAVGLGITAAVLGLLSSADAAFGTLVQHLFPSTDPRLGVRLPVVLAVTLFAAALTLARAVPPGWASLPALAARRRPVVEWAVPLALLDVVLLAFAAVQALVVAGAFPQGIIADGATPAERARHGFWQLVVVTLLVAATLTWTARCADPVNSRHRLVLAGLGGAALVGTGVLVASALARMWAYEQAFGWTVLRLQVGAFELWLAVALLLAATAWARGRMAGVPRRLVAWAGVALLALALAGPDALVARWNVARFERTGRFDVCYAAALSADARPALNRLPEPLRSQAIGRAPQPAPWYAVNLSRRRAAQLPAAVAGAASPTCALPAMQW